MRVELRPKTMFFKLFLAFAILSVALAKRSPSQSDRIVGGQDAYYGQFPYQISWQMRENVVLCGGSIYTPSVIVTAAHCCKAALEFLIPLDDYDIVGGELKLSSPDSQEERLDIAYLLMHPEYNHITHENDICLLYLDGEFDLSQGIIENLNVSSNATADGEECFISGWGLLQLDGESPDILQWATVQITPMEECKKAYSSQNYNINEEVMICAQSSGIDTCQGDSGGPLVCGNELVGITSFGIGCADSQYPGVYARASKFLDWIEDNLDYVPPITTPNPQPSTTPSCCGLYLSLSNFLVAFMLLLHGN